MNKEQYKRRKELLLAGRSCKNCGSYDNLEFDHIDPSTKDSKIDYTAKLDKVLKQISVCQVLCHNCHVKKTLANKDYLHRNKNVTHNGSKIKTAKLTENQVIEIRSKYSNVPINQLAKSYNVSRYTISNIVHNRSWKHLL